MRRVLAAVWTVLGVLSLLAGLVVAVLVLRGQG